jgi:hypothetical protein
MMIVDISSLVPLVTILAAAISPALAAIWAGHTANNNAAKAAAKVSEVKHPFETATNLKLDDIHVLVNRQFPDVVERLNVATAEIEELKRLLRSNGLAGCGLMSLRRLGVVRRA